MCGSQVWFENRYRLFDTCSKRKGSPETDPDSPFKGNVQIGLVTKRDLKHIYQVAYSAASASGTIDT